MNLDVIPSAEELKSAALNAERTKRQEKGLKAVSEQLRRFSELGFHECALYQDYMIKAYSLDISALKKVFEEKGYAVTTTKDEFGFTDSITIRW